MTQKNENTNSVEIATEYDRLWLVAPGWTPALLRDSVIDTFSMKWGMAKDEVAEVVDSYIASSQRKTSKKMKTTLFWEVDEIVHGNLKPAGSGSTTVDGEKADAMAHWDKYFAPYGYRLARTETA